MTVAIDETRASAPEMGGAFGAGAFGSGDVLAGLRRELDALTALDPAAWCDGQSLVGLLGVVSQVESLASTQSEAFRRSDEWIAAGAQDAAAWLTVESHADPRAVRTRLRRGRALTRTDLVAAAFAAGTISVEHVDRLSRVRDSRTAVAFDRDEAILVGWAESMYFDDFVTALDEWLYRADEDRAERRADAQFRRRGLHLSRSFEDSWFLNGVLDPISGEIVNGVLGRIERELFEADWAAARERLGCAPTVDDLGRTAAQRRADALVEMATRAATTPKDGQRPKPLFTILLGEDSFRKMCELASGKYVTPGSVARWLDDAVFEQITFDGRERVLSVSRQRSFTGAVRRAVQVRDRTCSHPYCNRRVEECEVDHIHPYARGGLTAQENGKLRCWFHNRLREPEHIRSRRTSSPPKSRPKSKQAPRPRPQGGRFSADEPDG